MSTSTLLYVLSDIVLMISLYYWIINIFTSMAGWLPKKICNWFQVSTIRHPFSLLKRINFKLKLTFSYRYASHSAFLYCFSLSHAASDKSYFTSNELL